MRLPIALCLASISCLIVSSLAAPAPDDNKGLFDTVKDTVKKFANDQLTASSKGACSTGETLQNVNMFSMGCYKVTALGDWLETPARESLTWRTVTRLTWRREPAGTSPGPGQSSSESPSSPSSSCQLSSGLPVDSGDKMCESVTVWESEWVRLWVSEWDCEWVSEIVSEWDCEWVCEIVREWVCEIVREWVCEIVSEWVC